MVIPTYEAWPALQRTLSCVIEDARELDRPYQVVVVDNGSSKATLRAIREFVVRAKANLTLVPRRGLQGSHFRPGSARNIGVGKARYEYIVFLDADCIPAGETLSLYCAALDDEPESVFLGHREFVDAAQISPDQIARDRHLLARLPVVKSSSNYECSYDRRLKDLARLDSHERPYDCLHGCNFALARGHFDAEVRFDHAYDGAWGYEDIDLGYQLHRRGLAFRYLPEAFVYHQEASEPPVASRRNEDRLRNIQILDRKASGFIAYRTASTRICPLPLGLVPGEVHDGAEDRSELRLPLPVSYALNRGFTV